MTVSLRSRARRSPSRASYRIVHRSREQSGRTTGHGPMTSRRIHASPGHWWVHPYTRDNDLHMQVPDLGVRSERRAAAICGAGGVSQSDGEPGSKAESTGLVLARRWNSRRKRTGVDHGKREISRNRFSHSDFARFSRHPNNTPPEHLSRSSRGNGLWRKNDEGAHKVAERSQCHSRKRTRNE
jgi:hypothetical protein